jgi:hypothetical protein
MKKFLIIGLIVALVLILIGGAGIVYARVRGLENNATITVTKVQNGNKIVRQFGYGPGGMMGNNGPLGNVVPRTFGPGMMGERGTRIVRGLGVLHDYLVSAFAKAVGLTVEEVDTQLANGETPKEIAIAQGTAEADLPALWSQVHQAALDQAVADGAITQAQADRMLQQINEYSGPGFGPGFGLKDRPMWNRGDVQP